MINNMSTTHGNDGLLIDTLMLMRFRMYFNSVIDV